jgi:hypothetical protein
MYRATALAIVYLLLSSWPAEDAAVCFRSGRQVLLHGARHATWYRGHGGERCWAPGYPIHKAKPYAKAPAHVDLPSQTSPQQPSPMTYGVPLSPTKTLTKQQRDELWTEFQYWNELGMLRARP